MLTWDELSAAVTNQRIGLVLPDGTHLRGIGRGIQGDDLILDVRRSSNSHLHPNGRIGIPREDVSVVDLYFLRQPGDVRPEGISVAVGAVAMSPVALRLGETNHETLGAVALIAGAVAGYIVGRHFLYRDEIDAAHVRITVLPRRTQVP
jgi:hypothetical protein